MQIFDSFKIFDQFSASFKKELCTKIEEYTFAPD